jgi:hypothetical protein
VVEATRNGDTMTVTVRAADGAAVAVRSAEGKIDRAK